MLKPEEKPEEIKEQFRMENSLEGTHLHTFYIHLLIRRGKRR
jgi:hypothetical protein